MIRPALFTLFIFALTLSTVAADDVVLKNGRTLNGVVLEEGDTVVIRVDAGTISIPADQVSRIIRSSNPLKDLKKKRAEIKNDDAKGLYELAKWAKKKELISQYRGLLRSVLEADSSHAAAREALGYKFHEGKWLTEKEWWTARGFVKSEGKWVPRDVAIAREKLMELTRREREKNESAERIAALEKEIELARIEVEKLKAENELKARRVVYVQSYSHYHGVGLLRFPCNCKKK